MVRATQQYEFRGFCPVQKCWKYGGLVKDNDGVYIVSQFKAEHGWEFVPQGFMYHKVDEKSVGQHTGYSDKNGKKIFEGDVCELTKTLKRTDAEEIIKKVKGFVEWSEILGAYMLFDNKGIELERLDWISTTDMEVLGNEYEGVKGFK